MKMTTLQTITALINVHLEDHPDDMQEIMAAATSGMQRAIRKANVHASDCQYAVTAMALLHGSKRVSAESNAMISEMLIKVMPNLDNTNAAKTYVEKLNEGRGDCNE